MQESEARGAGGGNSQSQHQQQTSTPSRVQSNTDPFANYPGEFVKTTINLYRRLLKSRWYFFKWLIRKLEKAIWRNLP